ncbi:MAG: cation transporter [Actinobacteria bacterium]|nr:cation transporter [Actinomycetota bacterium]MCG2808098.1 cation transporter [Coriobacteriia bacterium]MDP2232609.1 heavy-metal-associated domain-containing protein [Actinomycetota bacterium]
MNAVHIRTEGMFCDACPPRIEAEIEHLPGVKAAKACRSMHLTSVLFDPEIVDSETIRDRIECAGFDAHLFVADLPH